MKQRPTGAPSLRKRLVRIALAALAVVLAALLFDLVLLAVLEGAVNGAGEIRHIYEGQIVVA